MSETMHKTILLVDDSVAARMMIRHILYKVHPDMNINKELRPPARLNAAKEK